MSNIGDVQERNAVSVLTVLVDVGGLTEFLFTGLWLAYLFFGAPFRDLQLAVSFNKLTNQIEGKRSRQGLVSKMEDGMDCLFYFKFFLFKRLPKCMQSILTEAANE